MSRATHNPRGRPSSLKDPARSAILKAISLGAPFSHAARAAGVSYSTFRNWRQRGRLDLKAGRKSDFASFFTAIEKARSRFVVDSLTDITKAAKTHWTAAAWKLERLHPEHFALNRDLVRALIQKTAHLEALVRQLLDGRATDHKPTTTASDET